MIDNKGFVHCPYCKGKTKTKVNKDTILINFPLYCSWCKREMIVDVELNKLSLK